MKKMTNKLCLYDDTWIHNTKDNMPTTSLFSDVFEDLMGAGGIYLDTPGGIYLNTLRTWFDGFPLSNKNKRHMKISLESYIDVDHLGAVNEITWYEFMKSIGLKVKPLPAGTARKPDFEIINPLQFFCEVTTLNISEADKETFKAKNSIALDHIETIGRIIHKIMEEKDEQIKYGTSKHKPNMLVIFDYTAWSGLGTELYRAFADYLLGETLGFKKMPTDLSSIIFIERVVSEGKIALNLNQSAVYQNPFAKYNIPDNIFRMIRCYKNVTFTFTEIPGSGPPFWIIE